MTHAIEQLKALVQWLGVASQETVSMITGQYIPMDGNYIFNGIVDRVAGLCKLLGCSMGL